jgi:outer membrane protein TolC
MGRLVAFSAIALLAALALPDRQVARAAAQDREFAITVATPGSAKPQAQYAQLLPPELDQAAAPVELPQPREIDPASLPEAWGALPITLMVALRLAPNTNLNVGQAQQNIVQARAALLRASAWYLPNFNIGSTYSQHEGNIAKTEGNIIKVNKTALFVGGGPSMNLAFVDGIYGPLIAASTRTAAQAGARRVTNDTLLAVADVYFNVLRARRRLARTDETIEYLASDRPSPGRAQSKGLLSVVENFFKAGALEALKAEVDRVRIELFRRQEERASAIQDMRIASAELARLIRLDPTVPLWPVEDFRYPMQLPGDEWADRPFQQLLDVAIANRPELAENRALVQAAYNRARAAQSRPFLPNLVVNYNWGDFGGSPDIFTGTVNGKSFTFFGNSGSIRHFGTRDDFDVSLVWRLQNMGVGDYAAFREQVALRRQAEMRQVQVQDRIIAEIVQAHESILGWRERVRITARSLFDDQGKPEGPVFQAIRLNFERIRNVPGTRPLEVLDAVRSLSDLLDAYAQAITEYERARFRLLVVLGVPMQMILDPGATTLAPNRPRPNPQ